MRGNLIKEVINFTSINFSNRNIFCDILKWNTRQMKKKKMSHFLYSTLYSTNYNFSHTPFSFLIKLPKFKIGKKKKKKTMTHRNCDWSIKWNIKNGIENFCLWPNYRTKTNYLSYFLYSIFFFLNCNISCVYIFFFIYSYFIRKVKKIHGDGAKENFNN